MISRKLWAWRSDRHGFNTKKYAKPSYCTDSISLKVVTMEQTIGIITWSLNKEASLGKLSGKIVENENCIEGGRKGEKNREIENEKEWVNNPKEC